MKRLFLLALLLFVGCKEAKKSYTGTWKIVSVTINLTGSDVPKESMQKGMSESIKKGAGFEIGIDSLFLLDGESLSEKSTGMGLVHDSATGVFTGTPEEGSFAPTMLLQPESLQNDTLVTGITMLRGEDLYASGLFTCVRFVPDTTQKEEIAPDFIEKPIEKKESATSVEEKSDCTPKQKASCAQKGKSCSHGVDTKEEKKPLPSETPEEKTDAEKVESVKEVQ